MENENNRSGSIHHRCQNYKCAFIFITDKYICAADNSFPIAEVSIDRLVGAGRRAALGLKGVRFSKVTSLGKFTYTIHRYAFSPGLRRVRYYLRRRGLRAKGHYSAGGRLDVCPPSRMCVTSYGVAPRRGARIYECWLMLFSQ